MLKKSIKQRLLLTGSLIAVSAWLGITPAQAQTVIAADNTKITADIAAMELTRIAVSADRIVLVRGSAGAYQVSNDVSQGAIFIKPILAQKKIGQSCPITKKKKKIKTSCKKVQSKVLSKKPFYLFVSTEQGHHYVLYLTPQWHQHADMLVIKPQELLTEAARAWEISDIYSQTLIRLVDMIIHQKIPPGYTHNVLKKSQQFTAGSGLHLKLTERYIGDRFDVAIYQITNHSRQSITVTENEFAQPSDRAIYCQKTTLLPHQSIQMIKVVNHV